MPNFLQDHTGENSSMRLFVALWVIGVLAAWLFIVVITRALPDLPTNIAGIICAALFAKAGQKYIELNAAKPEQKQDAQQ